MNKSIENGADRDFPYIMENMKNGCVLVIGDIMLDRFVYGHVDRISPESPVPVLTIDKEDNMLGGAGNTLANLAGLGAQLKILSVIGDDEYGETVKEKISDLGADASFLVVDSERPTIVKTRYLAGHQQLLRTDFEESEPVSEAVADEIQKRARTLLSESDALIISDYGKGMLRDDVIAGIIKLAKQTDVLVIVDPKGQDYSKYKGADVVTPNKKELSEATRAMAVRSDEEIVAAAQTVIQDCGIEAVVATRSGDGMSVVKRGEAPVHLAGADIEVFDVSGAGDTVIAVIAAALAAGAPLARAAALANMAGSIVVTKVGTAPIRASELQEAAQGMAVHMQRKEALVLGWEEAEEQVRRWQAKNLTIGFTNGCFDILHQGHVTYLAQTKSHCDRLIIGLNRDSSVKILKGDDRPVHHEQARAAVLASLRAADMIVLFGAEKEGEDNTANALLERLKPDIYFKGGDYAPEEIPETPMVRSYGGRVKIMDLTEGQSTSDSIRKIKNQAA